MRLHAPVTCRLVWMSLLWVNCELRPMTDSICGRRALSAAILLFLSVVSRGPPQPLSANLSVALVTSSHFVSSVGLGTMLRHVNVAHKNRRGSVRSFVSRYAVATPNSL